MAPTPHPAAAPRLLYEASVTARRLRSRAPVWCVAFVRVALLATLTLASSAKLRAADVTWNNMSGSFLWNLTDMNWSTGLWNNANGDGAIFGATGAGAINVADGINVNSLTFNANGYTLGGAGSLRFVSGSSTAGTGAISVPAGITATINTAINSSLGLLKFGAGTLELGGPMTFSGNGLFITFRNGLPTDIFAAGGSSSGIPGGTIRIMNTSVLPTISRLGVSNGLFDFGANNITIAALNFVNQSDGLTLFNPATGAAGAGVIGTGTLRVTGEIHTIGVIGGNFGSNSVATNLDLGGGTQIVRTASSGNFMLSRALQFTGVLSNGSLLKTFGFTDNGILGQPDGMALYGNNTYTGSTTINGGPTIITGTNATTLVTIEGDRGAFAPSGTTLTLQGANGSLGSAPIIQAFAGAQFIIDNNVSIPAGGDTPTVPAAQNNNRIRDDAEIQLRDGTFIYRGLAATAASETFGNLNVLGGSSVVTLTPNGAGGTVRVTANGNLTLGPRATLQVSSATLGAASRFFVNGTLPAADATGILPRIASTTDFLTYNGATGLTPFTGYATDFSTPGTNVAVAAASTVASSVTINALKRTGTFTTTIAAGQTLGITSGMNLQVSGTGTFTGGTIAFGSNPGVFFAGSSAANTMVNSAITGSAGLINTLGILTLSGDLSGLTGTISTNGGFGVTTIATNTFGGSLEVRFGQLNLNVSQTLAGQGPILLGVPENDDHLLNNFASVNFSGAGADAIIGRDIIVNHGSFDAAGLEARFGFLPTLAPLNNTSGSQTLSGNITLNSPVRLQGGGGGGTGATTLSGNISGPAQFYLTNGRELLTGTYGNLGGFRVGEQGFTAQVSFLGTPIGSAPINFQGGNNSFIAYNSGSLPTGPILVESGGGGFVASLNPLQTSTINNAITVGGTGNPGTVTGNVAGGITANWNGPISGPGGLTKSGTGTLVLNSTNTYTGTTTVNAGMLVANTDGSLGNGNVSLSAASVTLILQNGATNNYIADTATLNIGFTNDTVNLAYSGTDTIKALVINGVTQANGTWGSPTSGAMHTDPLFTGPGILNVNPLTVSTAVSRKNHGGTDFDLALPLFPSPAGVESRLGGLTNDYTIVVSLSEAVTVSGNPQAELIAGSGTVGSGGTPNGGMVTVSGNTVTIPLTNVTSQQNIQVRLNGVNGSSSFIIPMGVLVGDTNGDRVVNSGDALQTRSRSGQATDAVNFRSDLNTDGFVNSGDTIAVRSRSGNALP